MWGIGMLFALPKPQWLQLQRGVITPSSHRHGVDVDEQMPSAWQPLGPGSSDPLESQMRGGECRAPWRTERPRSEEEDDSP